MKKTLYYLLICALINSSALAQDVLYTTKGDTLTGTIKLVMNRDRDEKIDIKINKKKQRFDLIDIKEYRKNGEVFRPFFIQERYKIGKLINEGVISHYLYTPFTYQKRILYSERLLIKDNGDQLEFPKALLFRSNVAEFVKGCPDVYDKVSNKTYGWEKAELIVTEYNACIAQQIVSGDGKATIIEKLKKLQEKLQASDKVGNKKAIRQMLDDLEVISTAKIEIPDYLSDALKKALKDDPELTAMLMDLLSS